MFIVFNYVVVSCQVLNSEWLRSRPRSRVIPQSSFYASFLISTHAQQRPVHTAGQYTCGSDILVIAV